MRKLFLLSLVAFFAIAPHALAQSNFVPIAPITGLTDPSTLGSVINSTSLANFFNNLYKFLIGLAAILAIIEIVWGGLEYSTQDSVSKKSDAKERIYQAIFGLLLVLAPALVFGIINPSILNLDVNLKELPTQSGTSSPVNNRGAESFVKSSTGCNVTLGPFQKAVCQTKQERDQWIASCTSGRAKASECAQIDVTTKACLDNTYTATCDTTSGPSTGPFMFIDIGTSGIAGFFSGSNFQPVESTPSNPNNGSVVMAFTGACVNSGGAVCLVLPSGFSSDTCPPLGPQPSDRVNKCYNMKVLCIDRSLPTKDFVCAPTAQINQTIK